MDDVAVTVYVPTFNRPHYLLEMLKSLRNQTFQGFRLVVIDNASIEDYTAAQEIVAGMGGAFERHDENVGVIGNFRRAFERPQPAPWFVILHDDDVLHPQFLAHSVAVARQHPELRFVACEMAAFTTAPPDPVPVTEPSVSVYRGAGELSVGLLGELDLPFPSVLYRHDQPLVATFDDDRYSIVADRPLLLRLAAQGPVAVIRDRLLFYRLHPEQSSNTGPLGQEHVLALFSAYADAAATLPLSGRLKVHAALARSAVPSWRRLNTDRRSPLGSYLREARRRGVLRYPLLATYGYDVVRAAVSRRRAMPDAR